MLTFECINNMQIVVPFTSMHLKYAKSSKFTHEAFCIIVMLTFECINNIQIVVPFTSMHL